MGILSKIGDFLGSSAGSAVSGLVGAGLDFLGGTLSNEQNQKNQKRQLEWEKMMSDTAVQRRVVDLKAAGINPLLATGGAAEVPNVSPAHVNNPLQGPATKIQQAALNSASVAVMKSQALKNAADADAAAANADMTRQTMPGRVAELQQQVAILTAQSSIETIKITTQNLENAMRGMNIEQFKQLMPLVVELQQMAVDMTGPKRDAINSMIGRIRQYADQVWGIVNPFQGIIKMGGN